MPKMKLDTSYFAKLVMGGTYIHSLYIVKDKNTKKVIIDDLTKEDFKDWVNRNCNEIDLDPIFKKHEFNDQSLVNNLSNCSDIYEFDYTNLY